ncbi:hypothetical protein KI387_036647, partial [Taxus chinensis]
MRWFMGLSPNSIHNWEEMEQAFLDKYQDYCKVRDRKEEIFRIQQKEDESVENYL